MCNTITYRHWQPEDDDAILTLFPDINEGWYRYKFDDLDDNRFESGLIRYAFDTLDDSAPEPEGVRLAFVGEKVVGHAMGESVSLFIEGKVQKFGLVSNVFVEPNLRRQGIATNLMRELHTYFERKGYRGSLLDTYSEEARQLYLKVGYQQVTRALRTRLQPERNDSQLRWVDTHLEDLSRLHQLNKNWARQNFLVWRVVNKYNISVHRALRRDGNIIGYARWLKPDRYRPNGIVDNLVVPDEDPREVIHSLQAAIFAPLVLETCEGSKYEKSLRSLGYSLEQMSDFTMCFSFGAEIDLTQHHRVSVAGLHSVL